MLSKYHPRQRLCEKSESTNTETVGKVEMEPLVLDGVSELGTIYLLICVICVICG